MIYLNIGKPVSKFETSNIKRAQKSENLSHFFHKLKKKINK